jgi:hypothetical protein
VLLRSRRFCHRRPRGAPHEIDEIERVGRLDVTAPGDMLWRLPMWHVVFAEARATAAVARSRDAAMQVACALLAADYDVRPRKSPNRKLVDRSLLLRRQAMS